MAKQSELTIEQCADQASQCRDLARQVMTSPHRIMLQHIADTWERIAHDIRRRGDDDSSTGLDFKV